MTDQEFKDISAVLVKSLEQSSFNWIVQEWKEEIVRGKPTSKSISELKHSLDDSSLTQLAVVQKGYSARESIVYSEPYAAKEELQILVEAIERGVHDTHIVAQGIFNSLLSNSQEIDFSDDADGSSGVKISMKDLSSLEVYRKRLKLLLDELKKEINAN